MCDDLTDTTDVFRVAAFEYSPLNENIESYEKMQKVISEFDGRFTEYSYPSKVHDMESSSISTSQLTHNNYGYDSVLSNSTQSSDSQGISSIGDSLLRSNLVNSKESLFQLNCQQSYDDHQFQPLKEITAEQKNQINSSKFTRKFASISEETKIKEEPQELNFAELSRQMYLQCQSNMQQQQQLEQIRQNGIDQRQKREKEQINFNQKENKMEIQENSLQQKLQLTKQSRQIKWTDQQQEQSSPIKQPKQESEKAKENTFNQPPPLPPRQPTDPKSECLQKGMCKIKELGDTIRSSLQTMHEKFKEVKTCVSLIADEDKHKEQWDSRLSEFYNTLLNSASHGLFTSENAINTPGKMSTRKPMSVVRFNAKPPSAVRFQKFTGENSIKPPSTVRFQIPVKKSIQKPQSVVKFSKPASTTKFNPPSMLNRQLIASKQNAENSLINQKQALQQQQPQAPALQRQKSFTVQKFQINIKTEPVGVLKMSKDIKKEQLPQALKLKSSFFKK